MTTSKILCLMMLLFVCTSYFSFGYALLHDDRIEDSSVDVVSTRKGIEDNGVKKMIRGRKLAIEDQNGMKKSKLTSENVNEFGKKTTKIRNPPKTETRTSVGDHEVDEDGLVAYTADYWRARHHPPKNN